MRDTKLRRDTLPQSQSTTLHLHAKRCCAVDAASDARMMRARLQAAAQSLGLTEQQQLQRLGSFHFANVPMSGVSDSGANFLPNLMGRWTSSRRLIRAQAPGEEGGGAGSSQLLADTVLSDGGSAMRAATGGSMSVLWATSPQPEQDCICVLASVACRRAHAPNACTLERMVPAWARFVPLSPSDGTGLIEAQVLMQACHHATDAPMAVGAPPEGWALESERLDASADWLPWPAPSRALPLQFVGDGCRDPVPFNLSGSVLMVAWAPARKCSYARILA